jgi:hypothetical protein
MLLMPHAEFDDNYASHPKTWRLSDAAYRLHSSALIFCSRHTTDGFILADQVPTLVPRFKRKTLDELVTAGMFEPIRIDGAEVSYEVHDYLDWNPSRAQIEERRKKAAQRKASWQARHKNGNMSDDDD